MSEVGQISINSQNIFPIIKKWLYSERDIFLRELVSNSVDAITKLKILETDGKIKIEDELKVKISIDKEKGILKVSDNGIGMTADEIKTYLSQIAFSGAEDFLKQYNAGKEGIIGHFGLGFYSVFMVSSHVEVDSKSWKEDGKPVKWECKGDTEYTLGEGERLARGTTITLHLNDDNKDFAEAYQVRNILKKYCKFMAYPIYFEDELINPDVPLWVKKPSELKDEDYKKFYQDMFPGDSEPLFWTHINVDYPFNIQGIIYFPRLDKQEDLKTDKLHLYCNRVFVSKEMNVLLPESFNYLKGFLDSPDIPLNVSRSFLQQDAKVRKIASHITRKIADALVDIKNEDETRYLEIWKEIHPYIKIASMRDEKFEKRVSSSILYELFDGKFVNIEEVLKERFGEEWKNDKETEKNIYYGVPGETLQSLMYLYDKAGLPVLKAIPPIDSHYFYHLERKYMDLKVSFKRVDSELGDGIKDEAPKEILDQNGKTSKDRIIDVLKGILTDTEVEADWFKNDEIPMVLIFPELERRFREMTTPIKTDRDNIWSHKCVFNLNHNLIKRIDPSSENPLKKETIEEIITLLYDLAALPHKKLETDTLDKIFVRSGKLFSHISL